MDGYTETSGTVVPEDTANNLGRTVITETAVAKVVGVAARAVPGVYALGSGASRSIGAIRDVVGATDLTQGVRVEVGESQIAADVILVAEYGYPLHELAKTVRAAIYTAVESLVGKAVIEVNIEINDVHIASTEADKAPAKPKLAERFGAALKQAEGAQPADAPLPPATISEDKP